MFERTLISKPGVIAATALAIIHLSITASIFIFQSDQTEKVDSTIVWGVLSIFAYIPVQLLLSFDTRRFRKARLEDENAQPTTRLKFFYSLSFGLMASLAGLTTAFFWTYFVV